MNVVVLGIGWKEVAEGGGCKVNRFCFTYDIDDVAVPWPGTTTLPTCVRLTEVLGLTVFSLLRPWLYTFALKSAPLWRMLLFVQFVHRHQDSARSRFRDDLPRSI